MVSWMIGAGTVAAAALLAAWAARRWRARRHASLREDLFEGLLPSAVTGTIDRPRESEGWGLRWADVTNLTAGDLADPPRRRPAPETSAAGARGTAPQSVPTSAASAQDPAPESVSTAASPSSGP